MSAVWTKGAKNVATKAAVLYAMQGVAAAVVVPVQVAVEVAAAVVVAVEVAAALAAEVGVRALAAVAAGPAVGTARVPQCADLVLLHTTSNPCDSTRVALQRFRRIVQSLRVVYTHVGSESCGVPSLYVGEAPEELYNRNGGKPAKVEWQEGLNNSGLPVEHPEFSGCCSEELVLAYIKTNMLPGVRASAWVVDSASTSAGASVAADASVGSGAGAGAGAGAGGRH